MIGLVVALAAAASAAAEAPASAETPRDRLAAFCVAESKSDSPAACSCYADFIAEHFSVREITAVLVLADPRARKDIPTGLAALQAAGLSLPEIIDVYTRVNRLGPQAEAQCKGR